jgi:outer membrane receptor for ferrienterochelin and colicins
MDLSSTISRDLHLNLKVYNSYYEKRNTTTASNWEDAGFASEDASASLGMNADVDFWSYDGYLVWSLGQDHLVTLGGEYRDEEREGTVFNPKGIPETRNVDHKAFYLQDEWRLTDSLNLTWGGRYDAISNADNKMTFKVGMVQTFSKLFSLRGNFAQGYRTPNIRELYIRKNTPTGLNRGALVTDAELGKLPCALEPEFVNAYELALEGRRDGFHYSVILFYNDISDKIQQVTRNLGTPMAYNTFENISDAETMGMEMAVGYDFKSGVGMDLNWSELDTEDKSTGKDLTFNPEREISATLSYTKDRFNIWTMGRYVGRQYTPEAHDNWVDDHVLVDVGLSYRLGQSENLEVYGGVNNLFDQGVDPLIGSSVGPYLSLGARVNF